MHYSSAVVLSTLAMGSAAAGHNRHASFHARRQGQVDAKRSADSNVNWDAVAVDLKEVDWSKVNWSSVFASPTPAAATTPAAAAAPTPEPKKAEPKPEPKPESQPKPQPTVVKQAVAPTPTSSKAAETTEATVKADSLTDTISELVGDLLDGVKAVADKLGCKVGVNSKTNNGGIWIGSDSDWTADFTNDANEDAVLYCWKASGFSGMSINVNIPDISVGIKSGKSVALSFAPNVPAACAPIFPSTKLALFGGIDQTWFEVTYGSSGAFDISRNVNMNGNSISAKGSKCTSDMNTCVFKCKDSSVSSCEKGTDYDLFNCGSSNGGGGGYDTVMQGTGGGCSMGASGEKINVVLS